MARALTRTVGHATGAETANAATIANRISRMRYIILSLRRRDHNISIVNLLVIALQHYRPGLALIAIERASGDSRDLCVVDDSHAVENQRHFAADQSYVQGLPFAGLLGGIARRRDEAVDAADSMALRFFSEVVLNLNLVTASQIDAAVTLVSHLELEVQLEVGELLLGDYVRAVRCVLHY